METRILEKPRIYYTKQHGVKVRTTLTHAVYRDGEEQAAFTSLAKARHYIHKLGVVAPLTHEGSIFAGTLASIQSILK